MFKRVLLLSCASSAIGLLATTAQAATAQASASSQATSSVTELVVTAEKREQQLQHVAIAITAFTAAKRDEMGINSIQDMTNFTPGLTYSTSTDRITLRGVGRTTNVLSADAPVANYDDGLYETFAVAAGRSALDLAQVVVDRGPQGTLGGRNALAGSLDEITQRPTSTPYAEFRWTVGNYGHLTAEAAVSGPLNDVWKYRIYGLWDYQSQGWIHNIVPGQDSEGNNINEWYVDAQIEAHFNDHLDMWTKVQSAGWSNPSGGPGDQSAGWTRLGGYLTQFLGSTSTIVPNAGFACAPGAIASGAVTGVLNLSPLGCVNPAFRSPWQEAMQTDHSVSLPPYYSLNTQWTWHADGFDIKYIGGGTYYHYKLWGPTGGNTAPIFSYNFGNQLIRPTDSFTYQEFNGFWSDELNFISTGSGPLQWVAGVYQFYQHYQQPVSAENLEQPGLNNGAPAFGFCGGGVGPAPQTTPTFGLCVPTLLGRYFDNRPDVQDESYAAYGQIDYKITPEWKLTLGIRYSYDRKFGTESVRLTCWFVCDFSPVNLDLTSDANVVACGCIPLGFGLATNVPGVLPKGVSGITTFSTKYTGLATRRYNASWADPSGTAGLEYTPDNDSLYYFKYGRGYKSGGYNIGIFTVLSFEPWTAAETVDSFEIGAKHTFGHFLTANVAAYYYNYTNLQIPLATINTAGGLAQSSTSFFNVPKSVSRGIELETTWTPIDNLSILFNYSFSDAYVTKGVAPDPADPNGVEPGAKPLFTGAQCAAAKAAGHGVCVSDVYTASLNNAAGTLNNFGWNIPQSLAGNQLPNAPRNKIAINVLYDYKTPNGVKIQPSVSYVWRDKQWGLFFKDPEWAAPAWDQWDARLTIASPNDRFEAIFFIKNIANSIGYDQGAVATRANSTIPTAGGLVNYVQGLNGPNGFNQRLAGMDQFGVFQTLYVTPPRTYGIELHYKFF